MGLWNMEATHEAILNVTKHLQHIERGSKPPNQGSPSDAPGNMEMVPEL